MNNTIQLVTNQQHFSIIDGTSIEVKSQYYKQLNKYLRSMIRALNKPHTQSDAEYYLAQLDLIKKEMRYYQDKFFSMYTQAYSSEEAKVLVAKNPSDY